MKHYYGYNRVSTKEQNLDRGRKAIEDFCKSNNYELTRIYEDKVTGKNFDRPRFTVLTEDVLREGDTLIVPEYDRLGRADETRDILRKFKKDGIRVIFLDIPTTMIDFSSFNDEMASMVMSCINDMLISFYDLQSKTELSRKQKRQREGIEAMKARGEWENYGRPRKMSKQAFAEQYQRVIKGEIGSLALKRELGLHNDTYFRYVREYKKDHLELKRYDVNKTISSFNKTFILDAKAAKKFRELQKAPGIKAPSFSVDRVKEGKEALKHFSSRLKNKEVNANKEL